MPPSLNQSVELRIVKEHIQNQKEVRYQGPIPRRRTGFYGYYDLKNPLRKSHQQNQLTFMEQVRMFGYQLECHFSGM